MVVLAFSVKVHSVAHVQLASVVLAVKSIWLLLTHATLINVKTVAHAKLLVQTFSDVFAQLVSLVFNVNNTSVILTHVYMVVSVWSLVTPSNANAHHNTLDDAVNC